jgi:AraC-like DNA-binding protein
VIDSLVKLGSDTCGRVRVKARKRSAALHILVGDGDRMQPSCEESGAALTTLLERLRWVFGAHAIVELEKSANTLACDVIVPCATRSETVTGTLRRLLEDELPDGEPTRKRIAARLHMSARTLHRRLVDEGTSFRKVLTRVRREIAERHLRERRLAISEIGFLLGFSEPSAFHRAFKRWTGRPPHAYRQRHIVDVPVSEPRQ